jgi:YjbR
MKEHRDAPEQLIERIRATAMELPEAVEERAWVGTRWCVRGKNFAHIVPIDDGWPPAYAKAAGSNGPLTLLTFRTGHADRHALREYGYPYVVPPWWPDIAGLIIEDNTDWVEVSELVVDSYRRLAPKSLRHQLDG